MNDFTKEELSYIKNYIFNSAAIISVENHEILRAKLQSMIDNYCEHEPLHDLSRGECLHCDKILCHECGRAI